MRSELDDEAQAAGFDSEMRSAHLRRPLKKSSVWRGDFQIFWNQVVFCASVLSKRFSVDLRDSRSVDLSGEFRQMLIFRLVCPRS